MSGLVTMAAGLLTGVAPAFYETRRLHVNPLNAIRGSDRVRQRWRHALVVFEIATTVALLVSTGAMLSSYAKSLNDSPGFDTHPILSARVDRSGRHRPATDARSVAQHCRVWPRSKSRPPCRTSRSARRSESSTDPATAAPQSRPRRRDWPAVLLDADVPMRAGRMFTDADTAGSEPVAIVNDVLADQLWPSADGTPAAAHWQAGVHRGRPHLVVGVVTGYAMTAIQPARAAGVHAICAAAAAAAARGIHDPRRR